MKGNKIAYMLRVLLAVVFITSGGIKLFQINGFVSTVRLFVDAYFVTLSQFLVIMLSVLICLSEIGVGLGALMLRRNKLPMLLTTIMLMAFTIVTYINVFIPTSIGSIQECYCFGTVLHFSPLGSFIKSFILLILSLIQIIMAKPKLTIKFPRFLSMIIFLVCMCVGTSVSAQTTTQRKVKGEVRVGGNVEDSFTKVGLPAFVTLLDKDSTVVDTATCKVYRGDSWFVMYMPKVSGEYTLHVKYGGYDDAVMKQTFDFSVPQKGYGFPVVKLKRLPTAEDSLRSVGLGEVVVRGTRLQVAYRGDTIVYDASAFNIPEGAMLDALVRQLPGAELKSNGDVYVNGKKLDYITLNGNDFFKGNNKVILENLPYFVVKELKVYHKDPPMALTKPTTEEEKDYVLDVVMKREYAVGTIANMEAGIGTDNRWKAKAFALRYDEKSRLSVFGNLNNTNEDRTPGTDGDWSPKKQTRGLLTTKQAGMNLNYNNRNKTFLLDNTALLEWSDHDVTSQQRSETFATGGNIMGGTNAYNNDKTFTLKENLGVTTRVKKSRLTFYNNLTYTNSDAITESLDSTYRVNLINTDSYRMQGNRRQLYGNGNIGWMLPPLSAYSASFYVNYSFANVSRDRAHTLRNTHYYNTGSVDGRNDYRDNTSNSYSYDVTMNNNYMLSQKVRLTYVLGYRQKGDGQGRNYYRLFDYYGIDNDDMRLPSTRDSLQAALDFGNSYDYFTIGRVVDNKLMVNYSWKNISWFLSLDYKYNKERIHYIYSALDTVARRNYGSWNPNANFQYKWKKNIVKVRYVGINTRPKFNVLMPLYNDANALNIRLNNPNLKSQWSNIVEARLDVKQTGMKPTWWVQYNLTTTKNAWGNRVSYDTNTGAYTTIADNVNGNWNTALKSGVNGPIDGRKRFRYDVSASVNYTHSVDFYTDYDNMGSELSKVNTFNPSTTIKLTYRKDVLSAGFVAKYTGNISHEENYGQRDLNVHEYNLGVNAQYTVPVVKLTIGSDINLYSQNGYEAEYMNTNDWVWNAFVSRPLFKGMVVAKVEMFDILHQLSTRRYSVNAQSRVETFYNSIPHYAMFSLSYKFAKTPKK